MLPVYFCYAIKLNSTEELRPTGEKGWFTTLARKGEKQSTTRWKIDLTGIKLFISEQTAYRALRSTSKPESAKYGYTQEEYERLFSITKVLVSKELYESTAETAAKLKKQNEARAASRKPKTVTVSTVNKKNDLLEGVELSTVFSAIVRTEEGRVSVKRFRTPEAALQELMKKVDPSYLTLVRIISETTIKRLPHC
jgi:hypothetical protein